MESNCGRGLVIPKGEYNETTEYSVLDMVTYQGSSYIAKETTVGHLPTDTTYWQAGVDMSAKMSKAVYDADNDGVVDNSEKVDNHTVEADVPADAEFTDTTALSEFTDVDISNPTADQGLIWDDTNDEWENGQIIHPTTFATLEDTSFSGLDSNQIPMYDGRDGKWKNISILGDEVEIVTFADGTDEQIAAMLEAHYEDKIDVRDYWAVGDIRTISLNAMNQPNPNSSSRWLAQKIRIVIVAMEHVNLATPIGTHTRAAITVQTLEVMNTKDDTKVWITGANQITTSFKNWNNIHIKWYLDARVYAAMKLSFRKMIKQSSYISHKSYNTSETETSTSYLFLPSAEEVFGNTSITGYTPTSPSEGSQFPYYVLSSSKQKQYNNNGAPDGYVSYWWLRSPSTYYNSTNGYQWLCVNANMNPYSAKGTQGYSLAPAWSM